MLDLRNCDCMDLMKEFPDKYFDLAIVDPPYGIGMSKRKQKNNLSSIKYHPKDWDDGIPSKEYFDELFRVSKHQIIWGGNYFLDYLGCSRGMICWDKGRSENFDQAMCEFAWTSIDKSAKIVKLSINLIQFTRIHPTEKPVDLYKWLLRMYAHEKPCTCGATGHPVLDSPVICKICDNTGKTRPIILDTHLGSMSIAIACHDYGYDLTGSELDKEYYEAGIKRVKEHQAQLTIF